MRNKLINYYNIFHFAVSVVFAVSFAYYTASFAGIVLFLLAVINILIFLSYSRDISIPRIAGWLKNHYFTTRLSAIKIRNNRYHKNSSEISMSHFDERYHGHIYDKSALLAHSIELRLVEYLIMLFSSSEESFHVLKEAMSERHAREIKILHEAKHPVSMHRAQKAIAKKQFVHWHILEALHRKLSHLHMFRQRKLKFLASSGISVFLILGVIPTLALSMASLSAEASGKNQAATSLSIKKSLPEKITIVDHQARKISDRKVIITWETDVEGDSAVHYAPTEGGKPNLKKIRIIKNDNLNILHEAVLTDLVSGEAYSLWLQSRDEAGNIAEKLIRDFSIRNMPTLNY